MNMIRREFLHLAGAAVAAVVPADAKFKSQLAELGGTVIPGAPANFRKFIAAGGRSPVSHFTSKFLRPTT
jgi:hypothetical protein